MPFILETIVATRNEDGSFHVRPYGLHRDGADWIFLPFRPSPAIANVQRHPFLTVSAPSDVRVIAGFLTGRDHWPMVAADKIDGERLEDTTGHMELEAVDFQDDPVRPRFRCKVVHEVAHKAVTGFNRAQHAVLEAAILSTRLERLPRDKVESEMAYLQIAIDKCAGPDEYEAWTWVLEKVSQYYVEISRRG